MPLWEGVSKIIENCVTSYLDDPLPDSRRVVEKVGFEESKLISDLKAMTAKEFQNFVKSFHDSIVGQQQPSN